MKILALDPGGTTGYAACRVTEGRAGAKFDWQQGYLGPHEHHKALWTLMEMQEDEHDFWLISESFEFRNAHRDGVELISREYIGVAKLFMLQRKPDRPVVLQTASVGKIRKGATESSAFVKKRNLQALNLWTLGPNSAHHMVDATGHLLYFLLNKTTSPLRLTDRNTLLKQGGW